MRSAIAYNYSMSRLFGYHYIKLRSLNPCVYNYDVLCNVTFIQWTNLVILQLFCYFREEKESTSGTLYNCTFLTMFNVEKAVERCLVVGRIFNRDFL